MKTPVSCGNAPVKIDDRDGQQSVSASSSAAEGRAPGGERLHVGHPAQQARLQVVGEDEDDVRVTVLRRRGHARGPG